MKRGSKLSLEGLEKRDLLTYYTWNWAPEYKIGASGQNAAVFSGATNEPVSKMIPHVNITRGVTGGDGWAESDDPTFDVFGDQPPTAPQYWNANYAASVDWGDGHVDPRAVITSHLDNADGTYAIGQSPNAPQSSLLFVLPVSVGVTIPDHTYTSKGSYTVTVTIYEPPQSNPTDTNLNDWVQVPTAALAPYKCKITVFDGGQLMYNAQNGGASVALPTVSGQQVQVPDNVVGHQFQAYITPANRKTIDHVDWTIPDAIQSESWNPTGFTVNYLPSVYTVTGGNGSVSPYWAHGNPNTGAPITSPCGMDQQSISAHVYYTDGTNEVLSSNAPVYMPNVTYSASFYSGGVTIGSDNTLGGNPISLKSGDLTLREVSAGYYENVGPQGYTGTMTVDPTSTRGFGGTIGMIQTLDPQTMQRTWVDTTGAVHTDSILQYVDTVNNTTRYNPPYLDDDTYTPSTLMYVQDIGTGSGTPFVREDTPTVAIGSDFASLTVNQQFMEYGMYKPGSQSDTHSVYVPLFKAGWQFQGSVVSNVAGGFGPNYTLTSSALGSTVSPITIGSYPTWTANACKNAAQLTWSWQTVSVVANPSGPAGPHDAGWLSSSTDPSYPVYVSSPTTNLGLTPVLSGSSPVQTTTVVPAPVRVDSPKAPVLTYSMPVPMGPRSIPFQATRSRVYQDTTPVRRFA